MKKTLSSNKKIWIYMGLIIILLIGIFMGIWLFRNVFKYIFIALILMYLMKPFIDKLEKYGLKKQTSLGIIAISFLIIIITAVNVISPLIAEEIDNFNDKLPEIEAKIDQNLLTKVYDLEGNVKEYHSPLLNTNFSVESINSLFYSFIDQLKTMISNILGLFLGSLIIVPILIYLVIKDGNSLKRKIFSIVPNKYFEVSLSMFQEINKSVSNFISAKLIQAAIITLVASTGFYLIGLKLPYLMGIIVGLFNIIPYLGPFIGAIPPIVFSYILFDQRMTVLAIIVIVIIQLTDNILIQPFLIPKMIKEHPLIVIIITLIGAQILGPLGMIIAIPVFSIIKTILIKSYHVLDIANRRQEAFS